MKGVYFFPIVLTIYLIVLFLKSRIPSLNRFFESETTLQLIAIILASLIIYRLIALFVNLYQSKKSKD